MKNTEPCAFLGSATTRRWFYHSWIYFCIQQFIEFFDWIVNCLKYSMALTIASKFANAVTGKCLRVRFPVSSRSRPSLPVSFTFCFSKLALNSRLGSFCWSPCSYSSGWNQENSHRFYLSLFHRMIKTLERFSWCSLNANQQMVNFTRTRCVSSPKDVALLPKSTSNFLSLPV